MAGAIGNKAWWMFGPQGAPGVGKGTPATIKERTTATAGTPRVPFSGGSLAINRVFGKLAETDASRNQGKSYAKVGGAQGTPETYVRANVLPYLAYGALGETTDTKIGLTSFYEHVATAKTAGIPYMTVWNAIMGPSEEEQKLFEQYENCMFNSLQVKCTAGEPLSAAVNVLGTKTTRKTGAEAKTVEATTVKELESGYVFNMNDATVKLGGTEVKYVSSMDFTITNGVTVQQTESFEPYDVVAGLRTVDVAFDLLFENIKEYNEFQFGAVAGTAESNKLFETEVEFIFLHKAGEEEVKFKFPTVAYESYPIIPNVAGTPIIVSVKGVAQRPASSATSIVTITSINGDKEVK